jgi:hypothetical protein
VVAFQEGFRLGAQVLLVVLVVSGVVALVVSVGPLVLKVIFLCGAFCWWFPTDNPQVPEREQDLLEACVVHKLGNSRLRPCPLDTCRCLVFGPAMHRLVSSADDTPDNAQDAAVVHHSHPGLLQLWQGMLMLLLQSMSHARASGDPECLRRLHSPWAWAKPEQP